MRRKIVLIGFKAAGKTTCGEKLASQLELPFYDSDALMRRGSTPSQSIAELYERLGAQRFRLLELEVLQALASLQQGVIATGGGAVVHADALRTFRADSLVVYLHCPFEEVVRRLKGDLPATCQGSLVRLREMYDSRLPLYRRWAHKEVDASSALWQTGYGRFNRSAYGQ